MEPTLGAMLQSFRDIADGKFGAPPPPPVAADPCIIVILDLLLDWQNMRRTQMGATDDSLMVDKKEMSDPSGEAAMRSLPTP
jgi:hypothetical protein